MAYANLRGVTAVCNVEGCDNPSRSSGVAMCEKHYYRMRRNGSLELKEPPTPDRLLDHSQGYKLLYSPQHPISTPGQRTRVYEHRAVYHAEHGDGPFSCNWCGIEVMWSTMHVDHLDDDRTNNDIANLVASCPICNQKRGVAKQKANLRQRVSPKITWQGRTQSVCDWAEELGFTRNTLKMRMRNGWPLHRMMTEPRGRFGPKAKSPK